MKRQELIMQEAEEQAKELYLDKHNLKWMFKHGVEWADEHPKPLWHDAQGDDLPPIDKEIIVIDKQGRVSYGHRPSPDGYITYKYEKIYVKTYGKGGWNIPDVRWWLDVELPSKEEQQ